MNTQPTQAATENPIASQHFILQRVWSPVFFEKLASCGVHASSDQDALMLMQMAGQLKQQELATQQVNPLLKKAHAQLFGTTSQEQQQISDAQAVKQAADHLASDADVAHAILALSVNGQAQPQQ